MRLDDQVSVQRIAWLKDKEDELCIGWWQTYTRVIHTVPGGVRSPDVAVVVARVTAVPVVYEDGVERVGNGSGGGGGGGVVPRRMGDEG